MARSQVIGCYPDCKNFDYMPELQWRHGYFVTLGVVLLASVGLYRLFKRSGWL